jgi:anti-anti-sigma factor
MLRHPAGQTPGVPTDYIETRREGAEARAALRGEFDMNATFSVEPALERLLDDPPPPERLTIDLGGLTFIDSTGMGVLLRVQGEASARGVDLVLLPGPFEVQRVFETAGLLDTFPFAERGPADDAAEG